MVTRVGQPRPRSVDPNPARWMRPQPAGASHPTEVRKVPIPWHPSCQRATRDSGRRTRKPAPNDARTKHAFVVTEPPTPPTTRIAHDCSDMPTDSTSSPTRADAPPQRTAHPQPSSSPTGPTSTVSRVGTLSERRGTITGMARPDPRPSRPDRRHHRRDARRAPSRRPGAAGAAPGGVARAVGTRPAPRTRGRPVARRRLRQGTGGRRTRTRGETGCDRGRLRGGEPRFSGKDGPPGGGGCPAGPVAIVRIVAPLVGPTAQARPSDEERASWHDVFPLVACRVGHEAVCDRHGCVTSARPGAGLSRRGGPLGRAASPTRPSVLRLQRLLRSERVGNWPPGIRLFSQIPGGAPGGV